MIHYTVSFLNLQKSDGVEVFIKRVNYLKKNKQKV